MNYSVFVSCPKGLEYVLETEVNALGLEVSRVSPQGVYGEASLSVIYQLCLWSRIANRVQLILCSGPASNEQAIHALCAEFPWETVFLSDKSFAVEFHGASHAIRNTMYGAQVVKDGIVDYFRQQNGTRPSVDKEKPHIRIHAYLKRDELTISLDLTGYSLHKRGYRIQTGIAPLKENVAAALLIRARWPELAAQGYGFHDVFCGAGTLVIEAAMMAGERAPGLLRQDQSFCYWVAHDPVLWEALRVQAAQRARPLPVMLRGTDLDPKLIAHAQANAARAGVSELVEFIVQAMADSRPTVSHGLVVCNPPYGERLGEATQLIGLYQQLGATLHTYYQGWSGAILTANPMLAKSIGLKFSKQYALYNGALACRLYCVDLQADNALKGPLGALSPNACMLLNRLEKNYSHLKKWAHKNHITCYRVYDADLPEYAYAIDLYNDYAVLQEYAAPASIPVQKAEKRSLEVLQVVPKALGIDPDKLVVKQRKRQRGTDQYQKLNQKRRTMVVTEGRVVLQVNLYDYLDTGLFLDHRLMRLRFGALAPGTRFLNCFCYTASASVHAAIAGALTTNVDLSKTYLRWAEENFRLNHINLSQHHFIQADCRVWMENTSERFDVIFLDPPAFSNSKRMTDTLDIQRDHRVLIEVAMRLLSVGGVLYFSTNLRQFKLDAALSEEYRVQEISLQTIDQDFKRNSKIHCCFKIDVR
ncbi:MAG: 23S rRNA (guanine(2445)-N(2))/(guanine(2069)-N(7))-methyltransferase [Gammaproteobacteria bacterium RIFCSPHIGHO2_12_FULL_45_9]|nr:MAG: 23S rRNA (guanine(2445)-N(2))/(guanine(2069)-N(7))-methyltransferase [Gammaproteobacteria bacterium RIFCSPHIGHO2_12_FULL_45_9]